MKTPNKHLKGIITRCTNYKESDRIFTLISDDGIMKFIARGAKKPSSKLSGHIEPLNYVALYYRPSKSLNSVSGTIKSSFNAAAIVNVLKTEPNSYTPFEALLI